MMFKELQRQDILDVFINPDEFGEMHDVNGKNVNIVLDDFELLKREKYKSTNEKAGMGVKRGLLYIKAADYGRLPLSGRKLTIDNQTFEVEDAVNESGVYSIHIRTVKQ